MYPADVKGLLLVDPASKETYERMAKEYPDLFMKDDRPFRSYAAVAEIDAILPAMQQSLASDSIFKGDIELLVAGSFKEWTAAEKGMKQIWIDELKAWAGRNKNVNFLLVDSGHFIQREKPEVVIEAVKRLAGAGN